MEISKYVLIRVCLVLSPNVYERERECECKCVCVGGIIMQERVAL